MTDPAGPVPPTTPGPAYVPPPRRDGNVFKIAALIVGGSIVAMIALFAALFLFVWRATAGPAEAADKFLATTATQGPAAAWQTGSIALQQSGSEAEWEAFARRNALTTYKKSHWGAREVKNGGGSVTGTVETASGSVPLTIELVHTGDLWQVQRVTGAPAGFNTAPDAGVVSHDNFSSDF